MASRRKHLKPRLANGRLSEAREEREFPPTQVRRLRDAAMAGLRDPEWGTELGRLYLEGTITASMYAAGKKWREAAGAYVNSIGIFPVRSSTGERLGNSHPVDPDSEEGRKQAKREANAMEDFFSMHHLLLSAGRFAEATVRRLCEHNEGPCGMAELIALRNGLSVLAEG